MSPESLQVREWRSVLSSETFKKQVVLIAVDEAHCISEWLVRLSIICSSSLEHYVFKMLNRGKDFRKSFKMIGGLRALMSAPFMALSASAPPNFEAEIIESLDLKSPEIIVCDLNRPNIFFSASRKYTMTVSIRKWCIVLCTMKILPM